MNILFIGPYKQSDGWGTASREYIRALSKTSHNLSTRPIYLNSQDTFEKFPEFKKFEDNKYDKYDIIIQNCLPNMFRKYGGVKNIGLSFFETTIKHTPWPASISLLDEMWVSSQFESNIVSSSCDTPVSVVPIPSNIEKFSEEFEYQDILKDHKHEFKFYFIGEFISRKNIRALITAFHTEFKSHELVRLVLKTNMVGVNETTTLNTVVREINNIKKELGLHKNLSDYRSEILITEYVSEENLNGLHKECDCFVMTSRGEGFCIPAFDAVGFNSALITNKNSSVAEYNNGYFYLVDSTKVPAVAQDRPLSYLYNGRDYWYDIDIIGLKRAMRLAYKNKDKKPSKKSNQFGNAPDAFKKASLLDFSYDNIAKKMEKTL